MKINGSCATRTLSSVVAVIFFLPHLLLCQPQKGLAGISVTLAQGFINSQNISTSSGTLSIGMAYFPTDRIGVWGDVGFLSQKDTSGSRNSEFSFTGNVWYYLRTEESLSTFLGGALGFGSVSTTSGKGISQVAVSGYFGAEYWFSRRFSWSGHIGVVYASYSVAERSASDVYTSAATGLTWYF
jgi:hypothetical protein